MTTVFHRGAAILIFAATLASCAGEENADAAAAACEEFVERRAGAEVEFDDEANVEERGEGRWYVRSRADVGEGVFTFECEVTREDSAWRLDSLSTDRGG